MAACAERRAKGRMCALRDVGVNIRDGRTDAGVVGVVVLKSAESTP
jgi:hypothetical protein